MLYPSHGYIDTLNHEIKQVESKKLKIIAKSNEIIFKQNGQNDYHYNSKNFTNKIMQKVIHNLSSKKITCKNLQLYNSTFRFSPKDQTRYGKTYHEYNLKFKIYPFEDTAQIVVNEFSIIISFKNELSCLKKDLVMNKKYIFEESQSRLLTLPEHCIQVSVKDCLSYSEFKKVIFDCIYKDISSIMISELKRLDIPKWDINLSKTNLDIENLVNDNIKVLIA